jgi:tRNA pseudouridine13 synthase
LIIREATDLDAAHEVIAQLQRDGVPNYYGEQRFGVGERNVARACAMLRGEARAPRDRFERKMLMSALQSSLFNRWLAQRVTECLYARPVLGDLLRKEDTGGLFINQDNADALRRMEAWEVSATGPMFGASMRRAEADAAVREQAVFDASGLTGEMFAAHAKSGEGTRRAARVRITECEVERIDVGLRLRFELPSGAYATTVLREVMKTDVSDAKHDVNSPAP